MAVRVDRVHTNIQISFCMMCDSSLKFSSQCWHNESIARIDSNDRPVETPSGTCAGCFGGKSIVLPGSQPSHRFAIENERMSKQARSKKKWTSLLVKKG